MINLTANPKERADVRRPDVGLSLTTPARNACKAVVSAESFQRSHNVASYSGSASKNAVASTRTNVHQNVHQRIMKDRIGYVRISLDMCCKRLPISALYSDSDPLLRI